MGLPPAGAKGPTGLEIGEQLRFDSADLFLVASIENPLLDPL